MGITPQVISAIDKANTLTRSERAQSSSRSVDGESTTQPSFVQVTIIVLWDVPEQFIE
jgi:hypothetical protein